MSNIESIIISDEYMDMCDIEVEDVHCYYGNGIVTHNSAQEIRITTNISRESVWMDALTSGGDVHRSCYSLDTEILTTFGWLKYTDIEKNTLIAQWNKDKGIPEYVEAGDIYFNYTDTSYHFVGDRTDILVTSNHRMYVREENSEEYKIIEAESLNKEIRGQKRFYILSFDYKTYRITEDLILKAEEIKSNVSDSFFCYSVPSGLLVVRRNNQISVCGNTAEKLWGKENYNKDLRKRAKGVNFGVVYGMGAPSLIDEKYGIHTLEQAQEFFEQYKNALPELFQWIDRVQRRARRNGTVYTYFGRPRRVKGYYDAGNAGFANRTAVNTQIQGCHLYYNLVLTDKGYKQIGRLYDEFQEVDSDMSKYDYRVWNGFEWCRFFPVERGMDVKYRLHFSNGSVIDCDSRHKVKVLTTSGFYEWVDVNDLVEGKDYVCFQKGITYKCERGIDGSVREDYIYHIITRVEKTTEEVQTYTLCVLNDLHQYVCEEMISKNTAGDILKIVMCRLWDNLLNNPKYMNDVRFMITIHDEIGYSVKASRAHEIMDLIEKNQTIVLKEWPVPIITEASCGWSVGGLFAFERVKDDNPLGFKYCPKLD